MSRLPRLLVLAAALLCSLGPARAETENGKLRPTLPPQPVPPLVYEDAAQVQHSLSEHRGHYLILNIWATWCSPCVREMPSLEALKNTLDPHQATILPLSEDRSDSVVAAFYRSRKLTLPTAMDHAGRAPAMLQLHGLPTTLILNPQGLEIARVEGGMDWASPETLSTLRALMPPTP